MAAASTALSLCCGRAGAQPPPYPKFFEPEKLTIGPQDNYQGFYLEGSDTVLYTQMSTLSPRLFTLQVGSDQAQHLVGERYDAKDPRLSPGGGRVAFIYYRAASRGNACTMTLPKDKIQCVHAPDLEHREPFWFDEEHLGYVARNFISGEWSVVRHDLRTETNETVYRGEASSPTFEPGKRLLIFAAPLDDGRTKTQGLYRLDWAGNKLHLLAIPLPGVSGFPQFSKDGRHLYFTQFLNDTNRDGLIDANDNGVVFRILSDKISGTLPLIPEQMTSVDGNCSYPAPAVKHLYLTCAFRGALDIYRLPLTGVVPTEWGDRQLEEAYWSARKYERRILLTNTRMARTGQASERDYRRLLFDHLQIDEFDAALVYLSQLPDSAIAKQDRKATADFISLQKKYSELPNRQLTPAFIDYGIYVRDSLEPLRAGNPIAAITMAHMELMLGNVPTAQDAFKAVGSKRPLTLFESYFYLRLAGTLFAKDPERLAQSMLPHLEGFQDPALSIYWAHEYLKALETAAGSPDQFLESLKARIAGLRNPHLKKLIEAEILVLAMLGEKDAAEKQKHFVKLNELMIGLKGEATVSRVIYVRALTRLWQEEEFKYLELVSGNWLRFTPREAMEFDYVLRQYRLVYLDRAYARLNSPERTQAKSVFYGLITGTDDWEAHYQYIDLAWETDGKPELQKTYDNLKARKLIGDSAYYFDALMMAKSGSKDRKLDRGDLEGIIGVVKKSSIDVKGVGMRFLLLGYAYLEMVALSLDGFKYDKAAAEQAHYNLTMAWDQAKDNRRIAAAALENLGLLNAMTRNFGLASTYYLQRYELGFDAAEARTQMAFIVSMVLYHTRQHDRAIELINGATKDLPTSHRLFLPLLQRRAFHEVMAERWPAARASYEQLLSREQALAPQNLLAAQLSYGYVLKELNACREATSALDRIPQFIAEKNLQRRSGEFVDHVPDRISYQAYGLASECAGDDKAGFSYRDKRRRVLAKYLEDPRSLNLSEGDLRRQLIKAYLQDALHYFRKKEKDGLDRSLKEVSLATAGYFEAEGGAFDGTLRLILRNYFALRLSQGFKAVDGAESSAVQGIMDGYHKAFEDLKKDEVQPFAERLEMDVYWFAYRARFIKHLDGSHLKSELASLISNKYGKPLVPQFQREVDRAELLRDSLIEGF